MKTSNVLAVALLSLIISGNALAQPGNGKLPNGEEKTFHHNKFKEFDIPGLTSDQATKLKELKLAHYKEVQPFRNQLNELRAKEHSLTTAEKPDLKAIDANIDEITKLQNQLMKARAAHIQKIRALLTDEQRMFFDSRKMEHGGFGEPNHEGGERFMKHFKMGSKNFSKEKGCSSNEKQD
jgi:Spy/CpxP family protein refolding chaperone